METALSATATQTLNIVINKWWRGSENLALKPHCGKSSVRRAAISVGSPRFPMQTLNIAIKPIITVNSHHLGHVQPRNPVENRWRTDRRCTVSSYGVWEVVLRALKHRPTSLLIRATPPTHPPNGSKHTSKPIAKRCKPLGGNLSFNTENRRKTFSVWTSTWFLRP